MKKTRVMILFMGGLMAAPLAYGDDATNTDEAAKASKSAMSDMMHRKTMGGGLHHPEAGEQAVPADGEAASDKPAMSDTMHRKTMGGGLHHPEKQ